MSHRSHPSDPVFTPERGSLAARIGDRMRDHRPITAAIAVWVVGFVVLGVVLVGLGLLLTHVLAPEGGTRFDASVSRWFVARRMPTLDTATRIGSDIGSTGVIIGVAVVAGIVLAIGNHWRQIGFLACALTLEFSVFLLSTLLVDRARPMVPRLDVSPPTSSYPSGHTAAAIALYAGLAIVIWSLVRSAVIRAIAWIIAVGLPIFVGVSRLYRGMHHLTDVIASVLLGCGALLFALLATRSAVAVHDERDTDAESEESHHPVPVEVAS
jgi:membrane-associated phospholipid phosphatase